VLAGVVVACALSAANPSTAQDASDLATTFSKSFATRLESIGSHADGVIGYTIIDITTGERFERLQTTTFPTASTIKLAILYELFKQADEGRINLDEARPLDRTHAVPGGLLYELTTPSLSLRDLAVAMILQSDNTAANVLIDRLGMDAINKRSAGLGLRDTRLRRRMIDLDAARRGDENISTPADLAAIMLAFHNGVGLTAPSKQAASRSWRSRRPRRSRAVCRKRCSLPASRASSRASAPTPESFTCQAGRTCSSSWGRSCARRTTSSGRSRISRASATSTSAGARRSRPTGGLSSKTRPERRMGQQSYATAAP
jgi:Beta-lactamase enzyme family